MHLKDVIEKDTQFVKLKAFEKVVYFVRHGESMANARPFELRMDVALRDAPLTDKGKMQARELQDAVKQWNVQVVIVSPLTRAMQTACLAFEKETTPLITWPLVTEFFPDLPECQVCLACEESVYESEVKTRLYILLEQGRPRADLIKCAHLTELQRFKDVNLDNVEGDWWTSAGDMSRYRLA